MLTKRQEKFIIRWEKIHNAGKFKYFLRCVAISSIGALIFASTMILSSLFNLSDALTETEKVAERARVFHNIPQMTGISLFGFGLILGYFITRITWSVNETQYHAFKIIQQQIPVRPTHVWGLRLGLHLAIMNNDTEPFLRSSNTMEELVTTLEAYWHVINREDAIRTITWLTTEGHRTVFGNDRIIAWDFGRLVSLARFFYSADYISEKEAWEIIKYAADTVQPLFNSWEEYHDSYTLGRKLWLESGSEKEERAHYMSKIEKHMKDPDKSLVKNLPWKMLLIWDMPLAN